MQPKKSHTIHLGKGKVTPLYLENQFGSSNRDISASISQLQSFPQRLPQRQTLRRAQTQIHPTMALSSTNINGVPAPHRLSPSQSSTLAPPGHSVMHRPQVWTKSNSKHTNNLNAAIRIQEQIGNSGLRMNDDESQNGSLRNAGGGNVSRSSFLLQGPAMSAAFLQGPLTKTSGSGHRSGNATGDENGSVYSRTLKDRLSEYGNPLRGPIIVEMFIHYSYFLLILLAAYVSNWARNIHFYTGYFYYSVAILTLALSRLIFTRRQNSVIPFYLSLPAFAILLFVSREAHMIVAVLWFGSFQLITLQSGNLRMNRHMLVYTGLFLAVYALTTFVMTKVYKKDCTEFTCGVQLDKPIIWAHEGVFIAACFMVVGVLLMAERFIRKNAVTLVERENFMRQLYFANVDLKRQLRQDKVKKEMDLEAPLTRATQILKSVRDSGELDASTVQELDIIISLLSSDQLFSPDIFQKPTDSDVHDWLNDMILPSVVRRKETQTALAKAPVNGPITETQEEEEEEEEGVHLSKSSNINTQNSKENGLVKKQKTEKSREQHIKDTRMLDILTHCEHPTYNVHDIDAESGGNGLYYMGWYIFKKHDFFKKFRIPEATFLRWLVKIQEGYLKENPYHNSIHAADVTHAMHYYVTREKIWPLLTAEEQIASIIAPIIHDYAHPGVNNAYLIATFDTLAIRYSDLGVLEHFHCSSAFELMQQDEFNFFQNLSFEERKPIRESVISMVLSTDMAQHFDWIGKFKTKMSGNGLNLEQKADRKLLLNMAMKCADVNNPSKPLEQCVVWTELIMEEFFRQGDREKAKGLPVSMFMNRETTDIPKCQIGFIDFIVCPLFEAWYSFMGSDVQVHLDNIQNNKAYWRTVSEKGMPPKNDTPSQSGTLGNANAVTETPKKPHPLTANILKDDVTASPSGSNSRLHSSSAIQMKPAHSRVVEIAHGRHSQDSIADSHSSLPPPPEQCKDPRPESMHKLNEPLLPKSLQASLSGISNRSVTFADDKKDKPVKSHSNLAELGNKFPSQSSIPKNNADSERG